MSRRRRLTTIALSIVAAACFSLAVVGGRWWTIGEIGVGPVSTQRCFDGKCEAGSLAWAEGSDVWERAGTATWASGMVASLVLVALAGALAAGRAGRLGATVALIATMTAIVAGGVFVSQRPNVEGIEVARGTWFFALGVVWAIGAAVSTLRAR
jgi:hypothetical protein